MLASTSVDALRPISTSKSVDPRFFNLGVLTSVEEPQARKLHAFICGSIVALTATHTEKPMLQSHTHMFALQAFPRNLRCRTHCAAATYTTWQGGRQ
eukprot:6454786-Amphidinium_carterae.1